jgi:orotidine-5'-phosphate decarboxylase
MITSPRIVIALDYHAEKQVLSLVDQLSPQECRLKVGKELFTACGPTLVKQLVARGFDVFLDLKFHDIPNTVAQALKAARDLGVWMVNVHACGGARMLEAARTALSGTEDPLLIAVTVLTSMDQDDLNQTGITAPMEQHIAHLAGLAAAAGLDGVVCSAREAKMLSTQFGTQFCLVTPGIRPAGSDTGDQSRVVTPVEALRLGSHYLVIGRPITHAADPVLALQHINSSLATAV